MTNVPNPSKKGRLILHPRIPTLSRISCVRIALELWRQKIESRAKFNSDLDFFENQRYTWNAPLVPKNVAGKVGKCFVYVRSALIEWIRYHDIVVFFDYPCRISLLRVFDEIIWYAEGAIDYEATARQLLASNRLDSMVKYRIACVYCCEFKIKENWSFVRLDKRHEETNEDKSPLLCYWNRRMNGVVDSPGTSINLMRVASNFSAFKYFWNLLTPGDQLVQAVDIVRSKKAILVRFLVSKLNETQLRHVVETCPVELVCGLAKRAQYWYSSYSHQAWRYVKDTIDKDTFAYIILSLMKLEPRYPRVVDLQREMWNGVTDEYREYVRTEYLTKFLQIMCSKSTCFVDGLRRDCSFVFQLLSEADFKTRNALWRKNWQKLIIGVHPVSITTLMDLCIENEKEVLRFKDHMSIYTNIEKYCDVLFAEGLIKELNMFLSIFSYPSIWYLKKDIVRARAKKPKTEDVFICSRPWTGTSQKIIFPHFSQWTNHHKYGDELVMSSTLTKYLEKLFDSREFHVISELVDLFPATNRYLAKIKKDFTKKCHASLTKEEYRQFDEDNWNCFLQWCLNDDREVSEFKKSLPVDDIFKRLLVDAKERCKMRLERHEKDDQRSVEDHLMKEFASLDVFLMWCFEKEIFVKKFKSSKFFIQQNKPVLKFGIKIRNEVILRCILRWLQT